MEHINHYRAAQSLVGAQTATSNPIAKHWHGEYSLGVSYWVNTVLVGCGVNASVTLIEMAGPNALTFLFGLALMLGSGIWQITGLWRSACRYTGSAIWSFSAKVIVVFGWMMLALTSSVLFLALVQALTFSQPVA